MTNSPSALYAQRIARVLRHIETHLDADLSVEALSAVAGFSPFHFHRQFSAYTGIRVGRLVQLMRLRRASTQLVFNPSASITDIGYDAGFSNTESFSRAFRKETGQTPTAFRANPEWAPWQLKTLLNRRPQITDPPVDILDFPETLVAALEHRGAVHETYHTTKKFIEWRRSNGLGPAAGCTYAVHHLDPTATPPEEYRFELCVSVAEKVAPNPQGVVTKRIPGGRCARVRHVGSRHDIHPATWIYRRWLPQSGERLRDSPLFFHYVNVGPDVKEHEMITDVYLPLE